MPRRLGADALGRLSRIWRPEFTSSDPQRPLLAGGPSPAADVSLRRSVPRARATPSRDRGVPPSDAMAGRLLLSTS